MSWSAAQLFTVAVYAPVPGAEPGSSAAGWTGHVADERGQEVAYALEPTSAELLAVLCRVVAEHLERVAVT